MKPVRKGLEKKPKEKSTKLFDFLNDITLGKENILNSENKHGYSRYMIARFLSMNSDYLPLVDRYINRFQGSLDNEMFHKLCLALIPQRKVFLSYVKGTPLKNEVKEDLKYICQYFEVSEDEAFDYYQIAGDELVDKIKSLYGVIEE